MKIGNRWVSLNALQTFEAAARHGHMGEAAKELNVTQSAVSHQVKAVEEGLGITLFERRGRGVEITSAGLHLMKSIQDGLDGINATAVTLQSGAFSGELTILSPVSFLREWLTDRLARFLQIYPNLSLRCHVCAPDLTAIPGDVDVAVVFDKFDFPGRVVSPLIPIEAFPVCAPQLLDHPVPLSPAILKNHTLIHEDDGGLWSQWFAGNGMEQFAPRRHIYAGSLHDAVNFARQGAGFALADWVIGHADVKSGSLVLPFGQKCLRLHHYYLVTRSSEAAGSAAWELAQWLKREVSKTIPGPV